jgi:hypothetical protein
MNSVRLECSIGVRMRKVTENKIRKQPLTLDISAIARLQEMALIVVKEGCEGRGRGMPVGWVKLL